jgi:hypothetical protein
MLTMRNISKLLCEASKPCLAESNWTLRSASSAPTRSLKATCRFFASSTTLVCSFAVIAAENASSR